MCHSEYVLYVDKNHSPTAVVGYVGESGWRCRSREQAESNTFLYVPLLVVLVRRRPPLDNNTIVGLAVPMVSLSSQQHVMISDSNNNNNNNSTTGTHLLYVYKQLSSTPTLY